MKRAFIQLVIGSTTTDNIIVSMPDANKSPNQYLVCFACGKAHLGALFVFLLTTFSADGAVTKVVNQRVILPNPKSENVVCLLKVSLPLK